MKPQEQTGTIDESTADLREYVVYELLRRAESRPLAKVEEVQIPPPPALADARPAR